MLEEKARFVPGMRCVASLFQPPMAHAVRWSAELASQATQRGSAGGVTLTDEK
jgi:hypothetical protein